MRIVNVSVDGACLGNGTQNPRAGYGVVFGINDSRNSSGVVTGNRHTNQVAEIQAATRAIEVRGILIIELLAKYVLSF